MNANQVAAVSALAAFLTALAALFTILEMRRQRVSQLRPELVLEDSPFTLYRASTHGAQYVLALCDPSSPPVDSEDIYGRCSLKLSNVGRGVARSTSAKWSFDRMEFAARLAPVAESIGGRVWIEGDLILFESEGAVARWLVRTNQTLRFGAVEATENSKARPIRIDSAYLLLLASFYSAACDSKNMSLLSTLVAPPLTLTVSYRDVEGTEYTKQISVRAELTVLASEGFGSKEGEWFEVGHGDFVTSDA